MTDFSFWYLFGRASLAVQVIILGLFAASILSWALIFGKWSQFSVQLGRLRRFEGMFWSEGNLDVLRSRSRAYPESVLSGILDACMLEWEEAQSTMQLASPHGIQSFRERIERVMANRSSEFSRRLNRRLLFLATLGSTAPFIGLFGTVLGIMNSFRAIATSQDASLTSVAPGIAESLFTTALGLGVAIPAIVAYNTFAHYAAYSSDRVEAFCDDLSVVLLRRIGNGYGS